MRQALLALTLLIPILELKAQNETLPAFEVASIKRNPGDNPGQTLSFQPGGRFVMVNGQVQTLITIAYPTQTRELVGAPGWVQSDRYDVTALAGAGATREQMAMMMRSLLADRFKLVARYETLERPTYALMIARSDGRLGPGIRKAELDCAVLAAAELRNEPVPLASNGAPRCGMAVEAGTIASGGITMDDFPH